MLELKGPKRTRSVPAGVETGGRGSCYLLFAGWHGSVRGGLADLVQTFTSEEVARSAFREVRLQGGPATDWARLVVVDGEHGLKPLCWFGIGATPDRRPARRA